MYSVDTIAKIHQSPFFSSFHTHAHTEQTMAEKVKRAISVMPSKILTAYTILMISTECE